MGQSPERLWHLHPWRHSKWNWTCPWTSCLQQQTELETPEVPSDLNYFMVLTGRAHIPRCLCYLLAWHFKQIALNFPSNFSSSLGSTENTPTVCHSLVSASSLTQVSQSYLPQSYFMWDEIIQTQPWTQELTDFYQNKLVACSNSDKKCPPGRNSVHR